MLIRTALFSFILVSLQSCSVFMAAQSREAPDVSVLRRGALRADVERELGAPIRSIRKSNGDVAIYTYISGDKANYGRAATYAVLTGVTLGLSEFVTSPIESLQGDKHTVKIVYGLDGRIRSFSHSQIKAPLEAPEKMIGIQS